MSGFKVIYNPFQRKIDYRTEWVTDLWERIGWCIMASYVVNVKKERDFEDLGCKKKVKGRG